MNWNRMGAGVLLAAIGMHAHAVEPWTPSDAEMASLPPYCKARMKSGQGSADYRTWESTLGKDFLHTHHYCAGINFINRYYRSRTAQDKRFNLNQAQTNLQYMVTNADPGYSLMPDVYLNLGVVYSLRDQPVQAVAHFNKAIELNPRQPKAYSALADYYVKTKQQAQALETVTDGLRHNPGAKSLQRRYTELGGKLPYPAPVVEQAPLAEPVKPEQPASPAAVDSAQPETRAEPSDPTPAAEPKIGSPTNPYCRFCPD